MNTMAIKLLLVVLAYILAIFVGVYFGVFYNYLFPSASGGSFIGDPDTLNWLIGYPLAVLFLLTFLMYAQGRKHVWWWVGVAAAPAILFEILLDPLHVYIPMILGLIASWLGTLANKALLKLAPKFMAKLQ